MHQQLLPPGAGRSDAPEPALRAMHSPRLSHAGYQLAAPCSPRPPSRRRGHAYELQPTASCGSAYDVRGMQWPACGARCGGTLDAFDHGDVGRAGTSSALAGVPARQILAHAHLERAETQLQVTQELGQATMDLAAARFAIIAARISPLHPHDPFSA